MTRIALAIAAILFSTPLLATTFDTWQTGLDSRYYGEVVEIVNTPVYREVWFKLEAGYNQGDNDTIFRSQMEEQTWWWRVQVDGNVNDDILGSGWCVYSDDVVEVQLTCATPAHYHLPLEEGA